MSTEYLGRVDRLLRVKDVSEIVSMGRSTIYRLVKKNQFPRPVKRGRSTFWRESDIQRYISSLSAAS